MHSLSGQANGKGCDSRWRNLDGGSRPRRQGEGEGDGAATDRGRLSDAGSGRAGFGSRVESTGMVGNFARG